MHRYLRSIDRLFSPRFLGTLPCSLHYSLRISYVIPPSYLLQLVIFSTNGQATPVFIGDVSPCLYIFHTRQIKETLIHAMILSCHLIVSALSCIMESSFSLYAVVTWDWRNSLLQEYAHNTSFLFDSVGAHCGREAEACIRVKTST